MFDGLIEDLTLATMADYDRLVRRLQLEGDASRAARDEKPATTPTERPSHHWWARGRRHTTA